MAFSDDLAALVARQLERFMTLDRHRLAGQAANLDFWVGEARHALDVLDVLDGYDARFRRLELGQAESRARHGLGAPDRFDAPGTPDLPRRAPDGPRRVARRAVADAAHRFLLRCHREGLIPESRLRAACEQLGVGVDPTDVRPGRP